MRFKTKVMIPAVALLTSLLVSLPTAQDQANANERRKCGIPSVSRSYTRLPYAKPAYNRRFAQQFMSKKYDWCGSQFNCLVSLWNRESGWRVTAHNRSSGAHGIPQALPGNKMASAGSDWYNNPQTQIKWGLKYIKSRYGTPCNALSHSNTTGWY